MADVVAVVVGLVVGVVVAVVVELVVGVVVEVVVGVVVGVVNPQSTNLPPYASEPSRPSGSAFVEHPAFRSSPASHVNSVACGSCKNSLIAVVSAAASAALLHNSGKKNRSPSDASACWVPHDSVEALLEHLFTTASSSESCPLQSSSAATPSTDGAATSDAP